MKTNEEIRPGAIVKAYVYGDTIEISSSNATKKQSIMVLPNHQYLIISTGEIRKMNMDGNNRLANISSVKRTMRNLRRLITANFPGGKDQLWITLTYAKDVNAHHVEDTHIVYRDFKILMQRLRKQVGNVEYITVLEPQMSGRWHLHVLLKTNDGSKLCIPNSQMQRLWGRGFTKTKRLSKQDNVASYVMAYVSNLRLTDSSSKRDVKGARLHLYPKGVRIYRRSKGIKDPMTFKSTKKNLLKQYRLSESDKRATYEHSFSTKTGKKIITKSEFYNRKELNNNDKRDCNQERT